MEHIVTNLNYLNEPVMFSNSILGNLFFDTLFGELEDEISPFLDSNMQSELLHSTQIVEQNCTVVHPSDSTLLDSSCTNFCTELTDPKLWTLYFDGFRIKVRAGVGYLLIDLHGNRTMLACHLEYECTNNVEKYKALVQGLCKKPN